MLRDGSAIGCISLRKVEPGPFAPRQVELLETFAAQAVIAIENVRLFSELRQRTDDLSDALEQQTAMADILNVISRSPTDVQPVLDAIAKAAVRFCGAPDAIVTLRENDETVVRAHEGVLTATLGLRRAIGDSGNVGGRAMREKRTL
jgi:GAF domain-containing protein